MVVVNDLLLLKPSDKNNKSLEWEPAEQNDEGAIVVSRRVFEQWKVDKPVIGLKEYSEKNRPPPLIKTSAEIDLETAKEMLRSRIYRLSAEKKTGNEQTKNKLEGKEEKLIDVMSTLNNLNMADKAEVEAARSKLAETLVDMKANNEFSAFFDKSKKAIELAVNALSKTSNALIEKNRRILTSQR